MESKIEKMIEMVEEFYRQIEDTGYLHKGKEMTKDRKEEREKLFKEEYTEYKTAKDKIEKLDAVCDMMYVRLGTLLEEMTSKANLKKLLEYRLDEKVNMIYKLVKENEFGAVFFEAFSEVHRSNMSKRNKDGTILRRLDGKVMKGPDYFPPNLKQFLQKK